MMQVNLYHRDGIFSFLPAGPRDVPEVVVESTYRVDVDYEHDTATLSGGPCQEPMKASEFAIASGGSGMFGLRRVGTEGPAATPAPAPATPKGKGKRKWI